MRKPTNTHQEQLPPPLPTLDGLRHLAVLPLWHESKPSAASVLDISRDLAYSLARTGKLPTVRLGRKILVPVPKLRELLGDLPPEGDSA